MTEISECEKTLKRMDWFWFLNWILVLCTALASFVATLVWNDSSMVVPWFLAMCSLVFVAISAQTNPGSKIERIVTSRWFLPIVNLLFVAMFCKTWLLK